MWLTPLLVFGLPVSSEFTDPFELLPSDLAEIDHALLTLSQLDPKATVRCVRVLVYTGKWRWLSKQLARSLPVGETTLDGGSITVHQGKISIAGDNVSG